MTPDGPEFEGSCLAPNPWDDLMNEADKHYYGSDGYLQDNSEARKLYNHAAHLGNPKAYERLGDIYRLGQGVRVDDETALDCYKTGANRGNYYCYAGMAFIFVSQGHTENARKSLSRFVSGGEADEWKTYMSYSTNLHVENMFLLLTRAQSLNRNDPELLLLVRNYFPQILCLIQRDLERPDLAGVRPAVVAVLTPLKNAIEAHLR